jgi:hypothetical protein
MQKKFIHSNYNFIGRWNFWKRLDSQHSLVLDAYQAQFEFVVLTLEAIYRPKKPANMLGEHFPTPLFASYTETLTRASWSWHFVLNKDHLVPCVKLKLQRSSITTMQEFICPSCTLFVAMLWWQFDMPILSPPFINIRCFRFVNQMYIDKF